MELHCLAREFAVPGVIDFAEASGQQMVTLRHEQASVTLFLQGAQVTSYQPSPDRELLWLSDLARYEPEVAIRGGIPICWPWFGAHSSQADWPKHGYARTSMFDVTHTDANEQGVEIILRLVSAPNLYSSQYADLVLDVSIRLGAGLEVELITRNKGDSPVVVTAALHNYFQVSNIEQVSIPALQGKDYLDKLKDYERFTQRGDLRFSSEVDRVFQAMDGSISLDIVDPGRAENTHLSAWGVENAVVWNPWREGAMQIGDFDHQGYETMVCVEPANALEDAVEIPSGGSHRMKQRL